MNGKNFLLAIFFVALHAVASHGRTFITGTNYKPKNEKAKKVGKNDKTSSEGPANMSESPADMSEEPFRGQNITKYFKNILDDLNNDSKKDGGDSDDGKFISQVSEEVPTSDEEDGDEGENAPGEDDAQGGEEGGEESGELTGEQSDNQSDQQSGAPHAGPHEGEAEATLPVQGENYSGSNLKYSDELYEDILTSLNKKGCEEGTENNNKYNEFKKEYDMFISLNKEEYEIIEKLVDAFSMYNDSIDEDADSVYEAIKKSFTDPKFRKEFKDFMNGIYAYAKRKHYIRGTQTEKAKTYLTLFENVINLLNMI
ncbi:MSP7-like protein [Plasmodium vivax]|uniref:Merozoite surface protein 7 (MSP7) n=3 Tax=Plasmodium vivax TaxID=5855 RepID=A0A0J9STU6_PLAV1|nr:merozoite surface protein 7 (MSP7) [Plasmodium vivax Brazil I]CAI7722000.1 MSP7-like protein [Plasmodium vivax]